ncbi:hypothetical protein WJ438_20760 [Streptomyces sp. GD-15H]|uniref:hypothetical protein n=1 Tax=Streptomyces sp. GD-15H TaxID=3129112 RepID=UPI003246F145
MHLWTTALELHQSPQRSGSTRAIRRTAPGRHRDSGYAPHASGVTGTTASSRPTARRIAAVTFSGDSREPVQAGGPRLKAPPLLGVRPRNAR